MNKTNKKFIALFDSMMYIESNFYNDIPTGKLALMCGLPLNTYVRLFRELFKITPRQYIIRCRLRNACVRILTTEHSFNEISIFCGFKSLPNFYGLFKSHYNMTPRQFRYRQIYDNML